MIIAAKAQFARSIELPLRKFGDELDASRTQHIARNCNDRCASGDLARRRFDGDFTVAPAYATCGCRERYRNLPAKLGDQRSQALSANHCRVTLLRAGYVGYRDILQVFTGEAGAEYELRRAGPISDVLGLHRRAGVVGGSAAGSVVDRSVGAHQGSEEFLGLAGSRVAAPNADLGTDRCAAELKARIARELEHRIDLGVVHPARAAIEGHIKGSCIGEAASADLAG